MGKNVHPTSAVKNLKKGKTKMANINILQMIEQCQVEWKTLGEVTYYEQPTKYLVKSSNYNDDFDTPVLTAGKTFILGYTDEREGIYFASESPVIIFDDFTTANKWVDFDFKVKSSAMKMITSKDEKKVLLKYIYYWLNTVPSELAEGDHKRQWISSYANKSLPIPPLEIQKEIVKILDKLTELEATLEAELSLREKQYTFYRDHLLTFGDDVEWKSLEEVVPLQRGKRLVKNQLLENAKYAVFQNSLQPLGYFSESNCRAYMTFIISAGAAGEIGFSNEEFWACDDCYYFDCPKESLNDKFLYYFLKLKQHKLLSQVRKASVPRLSRISIEKLKIPLPPLATQQKIVDILDKFETLTHSITEGLPKEIELRRKQYEYYREKLLTFPKQ
nr:restriction endonuclease subunit S [Pasteurella multocida]